MIAGDYHHQLAKVCFSTICTICFILQAGTGDEFLDELLSNGDASLDEGAVPDIKVMDSSINMSGNEVKSRNVVLVTCVVFLFYSFFMALAGECQYLIGLFQPSGQIANGSVGGSLGLTFWSLDQWRSLQQPQWGPRSCGCQGRASLGRGFESLTKGQTEKGQP